MLKRYAINLVINNKKSLWDGTDACGITFYVSKHLFFFFSNI